MYNFKEVEKKWQDYWQKNETFKAINNSPKPKYYYLIEFPYPSGAGLHVGHIRSHTALDIMARKKRMQGFNVLYPIGWDAFGAPAEQYAIANHIHPKEAVKENIKTFKSQILKTGASFDWSREFSTTDPEYYKWTQWQFLKFFEHDMAYKAKKNINWCPKCKTGLSNEDSAGGVCERCDTPVEQKEKEQWLLRMSDYAEDLIKGLDDTDFQSRIKTSQINWIGKSTGAEISFKIKETNEDIVVYTTRPDTIYGVTFMVLAPEHSIIDNNTNLIKNIKEIYKYRDTAKNKTEFERTQMNKVKTGVKIEGLTAINPVNNKEIPIYISDYVMLNYGTGSIMAVPAHDERDYEFAKKFNIPIIPVIEQITGEKREDEKQKRSIVAVIYDPKINKYLTINWGNMGGRLFVGGTIKNDEDIITCATREIKEETGYENVEFIRSSFPINHHYYAYNKQQAFNIEATGLLFNLIDDKKSSLELDEDEINNFKVEWVNEDTILNEVKDELHYTVFKNVLNEEAYIGDGIHINSEILNGLNKEDAINKIIEYMKELKISKEKTNYKLQDWIFSRQRFWGEPIPLVYCEDCGWVAVKEEDLPILLPDVAEYEPTESGESPLASIESWVNTTCPKCNKPAKRETDTMPNWAGSSWYWLRYIGGKNEKDFADIEALKYWGKVDWYNGGMEHATRHLLYARFWNQILYNIGLVPNKEPFKVRVAHGMVLGENGVKMSKSLGNVVNPDDIINTYGADTLRTYIMFIGDYEKEVSWSENGVKGCKRFIERIIRLGEKVIEGNQYSKDLEMHINKTIKKVTDDIDNMKFNTAISALMILSNEYEKKSHITKADYRILMVLLNPFMPHITEELNQTYNLGTLICETSWPTYDESKIVSDTVTIAISVNGKLRSTIEVEKDLDETTIKEKAMTDEKIIKYIEEKEIVKTIVVPNKIINIVVK